MASLNGLFSDPKKLTAVSDFLLGFSQGTQKANVPGASPFGAIGQGFASGGVNVKNAAEKRTKADLEKQQIAQAQELNRMKLKEAQTKIDDDLKERRLSLEFADFVGSLPTDPAARARALRNGSLKYGQTDAFKSYMDADKSVRDQFTTEQKARMDFIEFQHKVTKFNNEQSMYPIEERKKRADAKIAEWKAQNPEAADNGFSIDVGENGSVSVNQGPQGKVNKRKLQERWNDMTIAQMESQSTTNDIRELISNDDTLIGLPGVMQEHLSSSLSGFGRGMAAMGLDSVPLVGAAVNLFKAAADKGWGEAAENRIKLQSSATYMKTTLLGRLPKRATRLKSQVGDFEKLAGEKETTPELLLTRLDTLVADINESQMIELVAQTYNGMDGAIKEAGPDHLSMLPVGAMTNRQFIKWAKKAPVSVEAIKKMTAEKYQALEKEYDNLPDDWKRLVDRKRSGK